MSNEILQIIELLLDFGLVLLCYRFFGRRGLYAWICLATVLANAQVAKVVDLFGLTATLGNAPYASIYLATDILSENHGRRSAQNAVYLGLFAMLASLLLMSMALWYKPSPFDHAHENLVALFGVLPRIVIGSLAGYFISQSYDIASYHFLGSRFPGTKYLWLRNNLSTIVSQIIDTTVFTVIAFAGTCSISVLCSLGLTALVFKVLAAIVDTPFIYIAKFMHVPSRKSFISG